MGAFINIQTYSNFIKSYILYKNYGILLKVEIDEIEKNKFVNEYKFWDYNYEELLKTCTEVLADNYKFDFNFLKVTIYDEDENEKEYKIESIQDLMWLKVNWHLFEYINDNIHLNWESIEIICKKIILKKREMNDDDYNKECLFYERKYKELGIIAHLNKIESQIIN